MTKPREIYTQLQLLNDLHALGVNAGMRLLVHCSFKALGVSIPGGAQALVLALMEAVSPGGAIVMPTFSTDNSEPSRWVAPPVPEAWWPVIREHTPAYRPDLTPTWEMGLLSNTFRGGEGVRRNQHPALSFAAWGDQRDWLIDGQPLTPALGEDSPLARLAALDGRVLLIGVGYDRCTMLHLAEHRAQWPGKHDDDCAGAMLIEGQRVWHQWRDLDLNEDDFPQIGAAYEAAGQPIRIGRLAQADCRLIPAQPLLAFGVAWMERERR